MSDGQVRWKFQEERMPHTADLESTTHYYGAFQHGAAGQRDLTRGQIIAHFM